ncbi:MAG: DUF445 domain-containing protein [Desulfovibrionaceae bacterium]
MNTLPPFLIELMHWKYLAAPFICAAIGWFTNYLAVKMLFHPRTPVRLGIVTLHGVFPKRQKALARNLGEMIEKNLISADDVTTVITSPDFATRCERVADPYVESFIKEKLVTIHPMVGMFLNEQMIEKIKTMLSAQLCKVVPDILGNAATELESRLNFSEVVRTKVEQFSMDKLEGILFGIMKQEFRFIELVGGVLGFAIGVFQSLLFAAL